MTRSDNRKAFIAACFSLMIFGIVMTFLGTLIPSLIDKFNINNTEAGSFFTVMALGMLAGSFLFGPFADYYGYRSLLITGALLIMGGLIALTMISHVWLFRLILVFIGVGGGIMNGGGNALVSDLDEKGKAARLSLLGVFFGVGACGLPFVAGTLMDSFSIDVVIVSVGLLMAVPLVFFGFSPFPKAKSIEKIPFSEFKDLLKDPYLLTCAFILFFESGMETLSGGWLSSYLTKEMSVSYDNSILVLSLYWAGMMCGRFLLNFLLRRFQPGFMLVLFLLTAFSASLVLIFSNVLAVTVVGIFALGFGFAAGFPIVLGVVGEKFAKVSATAFSASFSIALLGGMSLPWVSGYVSSLFDLRTAFTIIPVSILMMLYLIHKMKKTN